MWRWKIEPVVKTEIHHLRRNDAEFPRRECWKWKWKGMFEWCHYRVSLTSRENSLREKWEWCCSFSLLSGKNGNDITSTIVFFSDWLKTSKIIGASTRTDLLARFFCTCDASPQSVQTDELSLIAPIGFVTCFYCFSSSVYSLSDATEVGHCRVKSIYFYTLPLIELFALTSGLHFGKQIVYSRRFHSTRFERKSQLRIPSPLYDTKKFVRTSMVSLKFVSTNSIADIERR